MWECVPLGSLGYLRSATVFSFGVGATLRSDEGQQFFALYVERLRMNYSTRQPGNIVDPLALGIAVMMMFEDATAANDAG